MTVPNVSMEFMMICFWMFGFAAWVSSAVRDARRERYAWLTMDIFGATACMIAVVYRLVSGGMP